MKYITEEEIESLGISPETCVDWVKEAFLKKDQYVLPTKVHVHPQGDDFITTMPCLMPKQYNRFGVKVVSRIAGRKPSLRSSISLYDSSSGEVMALIESNWITNMRTGAVAALAINTLRLKNANIYAFMGLGTIGKATLLCLSAINKDRILNIRLLKYKNQASQFIEEFRNIKNLNFEVVDNITEFIEGADVVVSAITSADGLIVENVEKFKLGVLLVPIHTRGFQNCDLFFDKVYGDDYGHIKGFKYFNQFKSFSEIGDVLSGKVKGREFDYERIISYNYGIAIHDVFYADKIYNKIYN